MFAFSADSKLLATGGMNEPIRVSSVPDGKLVRIIDDDTSSNGLAFAPDGKLLASLFALTTFLNPATGKKLSTFGQGRGGGSQPARNDRSSFLRTAEPWPSATRLG